MNYFITGIDTDSGKTLVSAVFCEAFGYDYWKPIQAGSPRDTEVVKALVSNKSIKFHAESYVLQTPASPHAAAKIDKVQIKLSEITLPVSDSLIIEGAGGCLVPLNDSDFVIDLISKLEAPVVLVADLYLGSINHTLLTIEALTRRKIKIKGIVFNGESNPESESIILKHSSLPCLLRIKRESIIDTRIVRTYANQLITKWHE